MNVRNVMLGALLVALAGCARNPRTSGPPGYAASEGAAAPTPAAAELRVYPDPSEPDWTATPPSAPPPGISNVDLRVAEQVSHTLKTDPLLESISGNIQTSVQDGVLTLRGGVPNEHALYEIRERLSRLPGVDRIKNCLEVELH